MSLRPAAGGGVGGLERLEKLANQIRERLAELHDRPVDGIARLASEKDKFSVVPFLIAAENTPILAAISGVFVKEGISGEVRDGALKIFAQLLDLVPTRTVEAVTIADNLAVGILDGIGRLSFYAEKDWGHDQTCHLKGLALRLPAEHQLKMLPKILKTCLSVRAKRGDFYNLAGMALELAIAAKSPKGINIAARLHGNVHIAPLLGVDSGDWFRGRVSPLEDAFSSNATTAQRARLADMMVKEIADKPYQTQIREQERLLSALYALVEPKAEEFAPVMRNLSYLAMMERFGVWRQMLGVISHWSKKAGLVAKRQRKLSGVAKRLWFKLKNFRRMDSHLSWERGDLDRIK
jgi:hypothetical protein